MTYNVDTEVIKAKAYEKIKEVCVMYEMDKYSLEMSEEIIKIVNKVNVAFDVIKEYSDPCFEWNADPEEQKNG